MTQYVGLDVSLKETKLHVLDEAGNRIWRGQCATEAAAIAAALRRYAPTAVRIGLEPARTKCANPSASLASVLFTLMSSAFLA
jgi:hypothetical protein